MTKAEDFERLLDDGVMPNLWSWCVDNGDLIARALRRDEAIEAVDTGKVEEPAS